jgi:hypothetical protein
MLLLQSVMTWSLSSLSLLQLLVLLLLLLLSLLLLLLVSIQSFVEHWSPFQFLVPMHSRQDSLGGQQPVARPLPTHRTK